MKSKTRKILSRIGAGLMLGISLFNLGAAWNKSSSEELPKRSRQFRTKEKEELEPGLKMVENIAEEEALKVLAQQQVQEQTQTQTSVSGIGDFLRLRYAIIGIWAISAGIFFSSMILNKPFALGKGVLSVLPGVPHLATMKLEAEGSCEEGEDIAVRLVIDSAGEKIDLLGALIDYDQEAFSFSRIELLESELLVDNIDISKNGKLSLALRSVKNPLAYENRAIAAIHFKSNYSFGRKKIEIGKEDSFIIKAANSVEKEGNILGNATGTVISISRKNDNEMACQAIGFNPNAAGSLSYWKDLAVGEMFSSETGNWERIDEESALQCFYDENNIFLLISGANQPQSFNVKSLSQSEKFSDEKIVSWDNSSGFHYLYPLERSGYSEGIILEVFHQNDEGVKWPRSGYGKLSFN